MTRTQTDAPAIITTEPERRQVFRVLTFPANLNGVNLAQYANWDRIAEQARELGAHWEVRSEPDGTLTVTMFWAYGPDEEV